MVKPGYTKGGSITVPFDLLFDLVWNSLLQIKTKNCLVIQLIPKQ